MPVIRFFARSEMATACDECEARFDLLHGGVCTRCQRILCFRHLHGSWLHRLLTDFGRTTVCVRCRAGGTGEGPNADRPSID